MGRVLNFLKQNWAGMLVGAVGTAGPFALALYNVSMNREDTATRIRLEDYQAISATQEEFNRLLDRFTATLSNSGEPDPTLVADLSSNISTLYSKVAAFSPNLGPESAKALEEYKASLAEVKTSLLTVRQLGDMDPLAVDLAQMYESQRDLTPILAKAAGKTASGS